MLIDWDALAEQCTTERFIVLPLKPGQIVYAGPTGGPGVFGHAGRYYGLCVASSSQPGTPITDTAEAE